jgi:hypothetical protein
MRGIWLLAIAVVAAILLSPGLVLGPAQDGAIFSTVGEQISRGAMPYRDVWDHKPPLIYVVTATAAVLPGATWPWVWTSTWLAIVGTAVLVAVMRGPLAALLAAGSLAIYPVAVGGGQTEQFAALAAAASLLFAVRQRFLLSGCMAGIAVLFSVQAAPVGLALVVLARRQVPAVLLGASAVLLMCAILLNLFGVLGSAIDALVIYSVLYVGSDAGIDELPSMLVGLLPASLLAILSLGRPYSRLELACFAWVLGAFVLLTIQGRHIGHYVAPTIIPLAFLAVRPARVSPTGVTIAAAASVLLLALVVSASQWTSHRGPPTTRIGEWIRAHTDPDDRILDWGVDANIYLASEREPAGRFPYLMPLVTPGYTTREMVQSWVGSLGDDPPAVIVDSEAANTYWDEGDDFLRPPPPGSAGGRNLDYVQSFRDFVRENYVKAIEIDGRKIYFLQQ